VTASDASPTDDLVSVLICTQNRPEGLEVVLRSLLASTDVELEIIVVDQSDDEESAEVVKRLGQNGDVRYHRSETVGLGAALGEGIELARSPYIVRTDDDCEAPPGWVAAMADALRQRPNVGVVFSNVEAAPFDPTTGYIPDCHQDHSHLVRSILATYRWRGLGSGMAFRREAAIQIGGFDCALGPGARFGSCEDWDLEVRLLARRWWAFYAADIEIVHHGYRSFAQGREHARRDWMGIGAMFGKLVRAGHLSALPLAAWELGVNAVLPPLTDLLHLRAPRGVGRIRAFGIGFASGIRMRVDRRTIRFVEPKQRGHAG
jgi:glycosyltransferase involved in cell wall biosynthesis